MELTQWKNRATTVRGDLTDQRGLESQPSPRSSRIPVFIDKEDGTAHLDVVRAPIPTSWTMYLHLLREFEQRPSRPSDACHWTRADATENLCARNRSVRSCNVSSTWRQMMILVTPYNKHAHDVGQEGSTN
jgi:hypothetical protein